MLRNQQIIQLSNLLIVMGLSILIMIVIGGFTRLTGSGLSIVEWQPITGILPPLNTHDWTELFTLYKTSPEFKKINLFMNLDNFKSIFWLEYSHRLWGRCIGCFSIVLSMYCYLTSSLKIYFPKIVLLTILIALQGILGWLMVKSGLQNDPHVSPFFLTAHLLLAVTALVYITLLIIHLSPNQPFQIDFKSQRFFLASISVWAIITFIYGALVAGNKAGLIYNEFPLMGDSLIPREILDLTPGWKNFLFNPVTIQWTHRLLAITTWTLVTWFTVHVWRIKKFYSYKRILISLLTLVNLQVILGIMTLIFHVPILLAVLHQLTGVIFLTYLLTLTLQSSNSWQLFAFQKFKKSPTAC